MSLLPVTIDAAKTVDAVGNALDKLFTSDDERAKASAVMEQLRQQPDALQVELNKVEAASSSVFVAGWRPWIGWVCGIGLGYAFVLRPILQDILTVVGATGCVAVIDPAAPGGHGLQCGVPILLTQIDTSLLVSLLVSMLGMSGLRSLEKFGNVARN